MNFSPAIEELIESLRCLPGVGPKSAQRMALHLLERDRKGAELLSVALANAAEKVGHCDRCRNLSELDICEICIDSRRDSSIICVVETPGDVLAVEMSGSFKGIYFVLMGHLSPIDGIGPEEIGLHFLQKRVREEGISELILATNSTVEGEATAYYLIDLLEADNVNISRIAHGVPLGGELEYVDGSTLAHAFSGRRQLSNS